jgi:transposase
VRLCRELEQRDRDWRSKSVILLDNASIHRSREAFRYYEAIQIPVMFLAPYSFEMAAVERLFAFIKNRDLNPLSAIKYSR